MKNRQIQWPYFLLTLTGLAMIATDLLGSPIRASTAGVVLIGLMAPQSIALAPKVMQTDRTNYLLRSLLPSLFIIGAGIGPHLNGVVPGFQWIGPWVTTLSAIVFIAFYIFAAPQSFVFRTHQQDDDPAHRKGE